MAKIPALDRPGPLRPWWMTAIVTGQTTNARLPLSHLGMLPRGDIALSLAAYAADTASTADADPGSAKLRWDHATQASATNLFMSDVDDDSEDHSALWPTLDVGAHLYLHNPDDLDVWQWWSITSVTYSSGYVKLAVTLTGSAGSFGDGAPVVVTVQQPESGGGVDSVNGQTGAVVLELGDLDDVDAASPTDGDVLTWDNGAGEWVPSAPAVGGDVTGPGSSTADAVALFDGTTGKLLKDGVKTIAQLREIEQNSKSSAYTLVLADAGKHILHPSADTTGRTFTIPANSSVAFPVGTAITFVNQNGAGVVTIAITSDTMRLAGAGTTGSRTLAANGIATALKIASTEWIINGTGLT